MWIGESAVTVTWEGLCEASVTCPHLQFNQPASHAAAPVHPASCHHVTPPDLPTCCRLCSRCSLFLRLFLAPLSTKLEWNVFWDVASVLSSLSPQQRKFMTSSPLHYTLNRHPACSLALCCVIWPVCCESPKSRTLELCHLCFSDALHASGMNWMLCQYWLNKLKLLKPLLLLKFSLL